MNLTKKKNKRRTKKQKEQNLEKGITKKKKKDYWGRFEWKFNQNGNKNTENKITQVKRKRNKSRLESRWKWAITKEKGTVEQQRTNAREGVCKEGREGKWKVTEKEKKARKENEMSADNNEENVKVNDEKWK